MNESVRRYRAIVEALNELAITTTLGVYIPFVRGREDLLLKKAGHQKRDGILISISVNMETVGIEFEGLQTSEEWGYGCCNPNCEGHDKLPLGLHWHEQVFGIIERHGISRVDVMNAILAKKPSDERPQECGEIWYPSSVLGVVAELL